MHVAKLTAPNGCEWAVRRYKVRLPPWRQVDVLGDDFVGESDILSILITVALLPFTALLIPLVIALFELPVAIVRGLLSSSVWVEAATHFPVEERYLWRTTAEDADSVLAAAAAQLSNGQAPAPARAEFVEHVQGG